MGEFYHYNIGDSLAHYMNFSAHYVQWYQIIVTEHINS